MTATGMETPPAENVAGVIEENHTVHHEMNHSINWGHLAIGAALIVLVWAVFLRESGSDDDRERSVGGPR